MAAEPQLPSDRATEFLLPWLAIGVFALIIVNLVLMLRLWQSSGVRKTSPSNQHIRALEGALQSAGEEPWYWDFSLVRLVAARTASDSVSNLLDQTSFSLRQIFKRVHREDRAQLKRELRKFSSDNRAKLHSEFRIRNPKESDSTWIWVRVHANWFEENTSLKYLVGTIKDISDAKANAEQLQLIVKAFENTSDGIAIMDERYAIHTVNQAFAQITDYSAQEIESRNFFDSLLNELSDLKSREIKAALSESGAWYGELQIRSQSGQSIYVDLTINALQASRETASYFVCVISDLTFKRQIEEDLMRLTNYDSLTKLPNLTLLTLRLKNALKVAKENASKLALLSIDLDDFKKVNDSLGQAAGDALLKDVAHRIQSCIPEHDTVARADSDEFNILLLDIKDKRNALKVCRRVRSILQDSFDLGDEKVTISPSIGVAFYPENGVEVEVLLNNAKTAMNHAKRLGKNNFCMFQDAMKQNAVDKLKLENRIRQALQENLFKLFYQPKVDPSSLALCGFEALIRWEEPRTGYNLPSNLIAIAEERGLIFALGEWILDEACQQIRSWYQYNPKIKVAINLSAKQFSDPNLLTYLQTAIKRHEIAAHNLELEITESTLMSDMSYAAEVLSQIKQSGFSLSLDDFGTGYSSLRYLQRFPVDSLKIDQSFVRDISTETSDANIVKTIINMAHQLGMRVVVEGVENREQLDFILREGGEEVQGYLFSKPVSAEQATHLVQQGTFQL